MRTIPSEMWRLWNTGGPFVGENRAHGRVTVEPSWQLNLAYDVASERGVRLPFRWFQRADNSQVEVELPNVISINIDRSLDADAATCDLTIENQQMDLNTSGQSEVLGNPGVYTWRQPSRSARARWGQATGPWANVLVPNALLRTYQGFGGHEKSLTGAIADGNVLLTGVWLIDEVRPGADGLLNIKCRDMAKLLIEQMVYPPLCPTALYPLYYERWHMSTVVNKAVKVYDSTHDWPSEPSPVEAEGWKYVPDIAMGSDDKGYYIVGSDGGVFAELQVFYGSRGENSPQGGADDAPCVGIAADPLGRGYWIALSNGAVFTFGDVHFYGSMHDETLAAPICKITAHPDGRGYWLLAEDGGVFTFGSAGYFGGSPEANDEKIVDLEATPDGGGYWLLSDTGGVFAYGNAEFHGSYIDRSANRTVGMAKTPDGGGYWIARRDGDVSPFGNAQVLMPNGPWELDNQKRILNDPIFSIDSTQFGQGYVLVGGDGGVFSFGSAPFSGSLPRDFTAILRSEGNYKDYTDIVRDLLLWAGWLFYGTGRDDIYGNLESTGVYSEEPLDRDMFDKKPVIDAINTIKEIVGYHFWIDDEGAARFESPNWFNLGNFLEDGRHIDVIPEIDEQRQLLDYSVSFSDKAMRSEIIIATHEPTGNFEGTTTMRAGVPTPGIDILRGMVRPAMWINEHFTNIDEVRRMAELVALHIQRSLRQGNATIVANPAIQVNDQIRIQERNTNETYIHYVRGVRSQHDLKTGVWTMNLTTNWLVSDGEVFSDE